MSVEPVHWTQAPRALAQDVALLLEQYPRIADPRRRPLQLVEIGKRLYDLLTHTANPDHWGMALRLAHGALQQALQQLEQDERRRPFEWAEVCHYLGRVCARVAKWADDPASARRARALLEQAAAQRAAARLERVGAIDFSTAAEDAAGLPEEVEESGRAPDRVLLHLLTPRALPAAELRAWLVEAFEVSVPRAFGADDAPAGAWAGVVVAGAARPVDLLRDAGLRLDPLPTGLGWGISPDDGRPHLLQLDPSIYQDTWLRIAAEDGGTVVSLYQQTPDRPLTDWIVAVTPPGESLPRFLTTDAAGVARLPDVPAQSLDAGAVAAHAPELPFAALPTERLWDPRVVRDILAALSRPEALQRLGALRALARRGAPAPAGSVRRLVAWLSQERDSRLREAAETVLAAWSGYPAAQARLAMGAGTDEWVEIVRIPSDHPANPTARVWRTETGLLVLEVRLPAEPEQHQWVVAFPSARGTSEDGIDWDERALPFVVLPASAAGARVEVVLGALVDDTAATQEAATRACSGMVLLHEEAAGPDQPPSGEAGG